MGVSLSNVEQSKCGTNRRQGDRKGGKNVTSSICGMSNRGGARGGSPQPKHRPTQKKGGGGAAVVRHGLGKIKRWGRVGGGRTVRG